MKWNKSNGKPPNRRNITQSAPLIDETPPLIHRITPSIQETTLAIGVLTEKCQQIQRETPENLYCPQHSRACARDVADKTPIRHHNLLDIRKCCRCGTYLNVK